ncbi:metallophosphoesterase [Halobacterium salinarum]|uniref:metallophosphoesterase n=1 Tax=Halobacterium salinarum TaxID=2242 RepID=UPI001F3CBF38|nr:metallophosphoesterase [Halobacterium salinarum]MCF2165120.1 metallophosphoesterase [Halobacterium salinarum]MCF2168071.1 metallophosphoesterase [Halobacterium salinarum]MCF2238303.1 metallophosphoesterase [Halobacterium salinarum]
MALVEPVLGEPAAVAETGGGRALVVADYHAGIEVSLRRKGLEVEGRGPQRRRRLRRLVREEDADRLVVLGDVGHAIGAPEEAEREELAALFDAVDVPATVVVGNHDSGIEDVVPADVTVTPSDGAVLGDVGFAHGHTWPSRAVLEAETVCIGHEHPAVRLTDDVGGTRVQRAWLRGPLDPAPFTDHYGEAVDAHGDLAVFPAFNDLSGGTWVNVDGQGFLAPFLPAGCPDAELYLQDGTRLGRFDRV